MSDTGSARGTRVNSLDWLRVLALLGVFIYHTLRPFDAGYWHVKSVHRSQLLTDVLAVIGSWGLAFFFLIAGASTFLALRWRTRWSTSGSAYSASPYHSRSVGPR